MTPPVTIGQRYVCLDEFTLYSHKIIVTVLGRGKVLRIVDVDGKYAAVVVEGSPAFAVRLAAFYDKNLFILLDSKSSPAELVAAAFRP